MEIVRSRGVTIFGFLNKYIFGILGFIGYMILLLGPMSFSSEAQQEIIKVRVPIFNPEIFRQMAIFLLPSAIISVFLIITGHGLLRLNDKARKLTIFLAIISITINATSYLFTKRGFSIVNNAYFILLIYYFTRPKVKEQFK